MSVLRKLAGQTAIYGLSLLFAFATLAAACGRKTSRELLIGTWRTMPNGHDTTRFFGDRLVWYAVDQGFTDTCRYRVEGDSIWITLGAHSRVTVTHGSSIEFDGPNKFRLLDANSITEFDSWFERTSQ